MACDHGIIMKMYKYTPSSLGIVKYIKSPRKICTKNYDKWVFVVNAKNNLGNEEHEERMSIKNKS